jgi:dTDP-4-amino-4,6-dideoxygalactose transaminase
VRPAALGGVPAFETLLPLTRPAVPAVGRLLARFDPVLRSGLITNGAEVRAFENRVAEYLGVGNVVAVSNCTTGLMLLLRCLDLHGGVVVPSFTFMASGHAVRWNGLPLLFADSDPLTCTADPASVAAAVHRGAAAILATHTYGAPCDVDALAEVAERTGVALLFDAAHGFGARYPDGRMVGGKGVAEVFSLSPTKTLTSGEGGLITTDDDALARRLRVGREYGNAGDYDAVLLGLNGRLTELAAALGAEALADFPATLERRLHLVERYRKVLDGLPGIGFQRVPDGARSAYKDLAIRVEDGFGLSRDRLVACLRAERIATRSYFDPPLHRQTAYADVPPHGDLSGTETLARTMLTLPLSVHMDFGMVDRVCDAIERIHAHREDLARRSPATEAR